jgi:general L-amino acid transport system substrate-binding protein
MKALRLSITRALGRRRAWPPRSSAAFAQAPSPGRRRRADAGRDPRARHADLRREHRPRRLRQPDSQGVWRGFDVDYCRAFAIALFNDPNRVRYVPTTAQNRFTALQSGEVDVLSRNTTWTLSRDTSLGFDFTGINFYDGQGFMVRTSAGVRNARDLNGATICVQPGTTTEQNLADWARGARVRFTPVVIERLEEVVQAYLSGRCDAYTTDVSGLAAVRGTQQNPNEHTILPEVISKEPLGPLIRHGDQRFADIVRWLAFRPDRRRGVRRHRRQRAADAGQRPPARGAALLGRTGGLARCWAWTMPGCST